MIRPVDMQLGYWKVEQQASHAKSPDSSFAQTMQSQEIVKEAHEKETRVQQGDETQTEDKIKEKKEHSHQGSWEGEEEHQEEEGDESSLSSDAFLSAKPSTKGLDLYG